MSETVSEEHATMVKALRWGDPRIKPKAWVRIEVDPVSGCWHWSGATNREGYGRLGDTVAHLTVYRSLVGATPVGLYADHICHDPAECAGGKTCAHRRCVNPAHLAWSTPGQNLALGRRNRWGRAGDGDVCKHGHEFTPENTSRQLSRGEWVRRCKACSRETARRWQAKKRGRDPGAFAPRMDDEPRKQAAPRTHCKYGHAFTPANTYVRPDGRGRDCVMCRRRRDKT